LGQLSFGIWRRQPQSREKARGRDRREQLPAAASNKAGILKDLLFFQETVQSVESG
jgi:hypothetical protein